MTKVITKEFEGKTIKDILRRELRYSSGLIKKLKAREDGITVNARHVTVRYVLKEGDVLCLNDEDREENTSPYIIPVDLPIGIAYEDSAVTVADKPSAMPAHPSYSHRDDTVANALAFRHEGGPYVFRPVNRLDGDTSGLMICARTHLSAFRLGRAMIEGAIGKMYVAVLSRPVPEEYGVIDKHMKRCEASIITRRVCDESEEGARRAVTVYRRVLTLENGRCVVIASPVTGRTHQLRVHFTSLGCPLVGDSLYFEADGDIDRHALHAAFCSFPHPESGETVRVYSPLPDDMRRLMGGEAAQITQKALREEADGPLKELYDKMKKDIR